MEEYIVKIIIQRVFDDFEDIKKISSILTGLQSDHIASSSIIFNTKF